MAKKIEWEIHIDGYGYQFTVTAPTRNDAIGMAELQWKDDFAWENEMVGEILEDGTLFKRTPMPEFIAVKIK